MRQKDILPIVAKPSDKAQAMNGTHETQQQTALQLESWKFVSGIISNLESFLDKQNYLWRNQILSFGKIIQALKDGVFHGLLKQPTGAGKTIIFLEFLKAANTSSLILVPRKELIDDTKTALVGDLEQGVEGIGYSTDKVYTIQPETSSKNSSELLKDLLVEIESQDNFNGVVIMTYQSLLSIYKTNQDLLDRFMKYIKISISDEAHKSLGEKTSEAILEYDEKLDIIQQTQQDISEAYKQEGVELVLDAENADDVEDLEEQEVETIMQNKFSNIHYRFTATPKTNQKDVQEVLGIPVIDWVPIIDLVKDKNLVLPKCESIGAAYYKTDKQEYVGDKLLKELAEKEKFQMEGGRTVAEVTTDRYIELKEKHKGYLPGEAFCGTIAQAESYTQYLLSRGIRAIRCTSNNTEYDGGVSSYDAKRMLQHNEADVVVTVDKLSLGWDVPTLRCAMWLTPRQSPAVKIQGGGRIMRKITAKMFEYLKQFIPKSAYSEIYKHGNNTYNIEADWYVTFLEQEWGDSENQKEFSENKQKKGKTLFRAKSFFETLIKEGEMTLEQLSELTDDQTWEQVNQNLLEKKRLADIISSKEDILLLEAAIGKKIEEITHPQKNINPFEIEINGIHYESTIRKLTNHIGFKITGNHSNNFAGLKYLLLIKKVGTAEEATELFKLNKPLEEVLINQNSIEILEKAVGGKLEEITGLKYKKHPFEIEINGFPYKDSISKLTDRLCYKILGKHGQPSLGLKYLILIKQGKTPEEATDLLKSNNLLEEVIINKNSIEVLEKAVGKKLEEITRPRDKKNPFEIKINGLIYKDSISKLTDRLCYKIIGKHGQLSIGLKYLILIKQGKTAEEAKKILKTTKKLEDMLINQTTIKLLEQAIGKKLEEITNPQDKSQIFKIEVNGFSYTDSLNKLLNRISKKITGKYGSYYIGLKYLLLLKQGKMPKEAEKILKIKKVTLIKALADPVAIELLEQGIGKRLEAINNVKEENETFEIYINGTKYKDTIKKLTGRIGNIAIKRPNNYTLGMRYLILIKQGKTPKEAINIINKKTKKLEEVIVNQESIGVLESAIGKTLEEIISTSTETQECEIIMNNFSYTDSLSKLLNRIGKKITGKYGYYPIGLKYLLLLKQGKTPEEAEKMIKAKKIH